MATSIRFSDDAFLDNVRATAVKHDRTLENQIIHWAQIGCAVEHSGVVDISKISRVLSGKLETTALSEVEKFLWSEQFVAKMSEAGTEEKAFFRKLRKSGKANDQIT